MVDIQFIREHPEEVQQKSQQKGYNVDITKLLAVDAERLSLLQQVEQLRQQRNENADAIKQAGKPDATLIDQGKTIKVSLAEREALLDAAHKEWISLLKKVPNMPLEDVPVGGSEAENVTTHEWGDKPSFDFSPKSHADIAEAKQWIDKVRAAKVTGSRFAYLRGDLVKLQFAIIQYVFDTVTNKEVIKKIISEKNLQIIDTPFTPILPPLMIREEVYDQMDRLEPREDRYHIDGEDDNLWLIGSAEHTLGSMYVGESLSVSELPLRYIGYSTSFRQEAGTYGKDTEGIFRMHQFDKLEMEVFSTPESGIEEHQLLVGLQEYMMQQLGIPYRVLLKCTADIGKPNARGVDIEAWMPSQGTYRETHTADYMTDYQSRRLQTKFKTNAGEHVLVHTNDATAFALGRTMIAIIENYQTADGDVLIPDVLKPYSNGRERI